MSNLTSEDLKKLSAPFPAASMGVKVQSFSKDRTKAMLVLYLQHTDVYTRLEEVDPAWSCAVTDEKQTLPDEKGNVICTVRMKMTVKGVSRENAGEGGDPKSAISDAVKRCAMLFGVGRYLYDSEQVWIPYNENTDRFKSFSMADYNRALRPGQTKTPTDDDTPPSGGNAPTPIRSHPAITSGPVTPKAETPRTRASLGAEIMRVGMALGMTKQDIEQWAFEDFKKPSKDLTLAEMQTFLNIFLGEAGRAGVAV